MYGQASRRSRSTAPDWPAFTRAPFDIVAFDLDGTLVDTAPDLTSALNHCLGLLGHAPVPDESVRHLVGHGARALLRAGLEANGGWSEELVEASVPEFLAYYAANICVRSRPYPGLERVLDELSAAGSRLAICTNKPERLTHVLVEALGWGGRFVSIVGGDTCATRKPDPAPLLNAVARAGGGSAVFVGDSIVDAETARAVGLPFIAVSFGFSDRPVTELGADAVIDRYEQLLQVLEQV